MGGFIPPGAGSAIAGFDIIPGAAALSLAGIGTGTSLAMANIGAAGYFGGFGANMALAGSSLSSGAIGTAIGAAMPYLAPIIAIAALASIFGGSEDSLSIRMRTGATQREAGGGREGAFGFVNISGKNLGESSKELEDAIIGLDDTMSQFLDPGEIAKVSTRVQGYNYRDNLGTKFSSKEQYNLFAGRTREVYDALGLGGVFDELTESIKHTKSGIQAMLETTTKFLALRDSIRDWGKELETPLSTIGAAVEGIRENAKALRDEVRDLGLSTEWVSEQMDTIAEGTRTRIGFLRDQFNDEIQGAILSITDPLIYSLERHNEIAQQRLDDAALIYADIADVELLNALEREAIVKSHLTSMNSAYGSAFDQIESYVDSFGLSSTSPLTPRERLATSQDAYRDTLSRAAQGDVSALQALPGVAGTLLSEAQNVFAGTGNFTAFFDMVENDLTRLLGREFNITMDPVVTELRNLGAQGILSNQEITDLLTEIRNELRNSGADQRDAELLKVG
jgi:hypothetical protein